MHDVPKRSDAQPCQRHCCRAEQRRGGSDCSMYDAAVVQNEAAITDMDISCISTRWHIADRSCQSVNQQCQDLFYCCAKMCQHRRGRGLAGAWMQTTHQAGKKKNNNRSDITPDPAGHRPQRPCAQGRTCAKQAQPQASALGQNRTQFGGGATTHGLRTRQAGKSVPTQTRPGAGGCTLQSTPQEGTLHQDPKPQLHVPRGHTAQGSCRVEQERDNTSRGSNNGDTTGRKRRQQHRLRVVRPRARPEEVIPEKGKCYRAVLARDTLAFKQQMFNVAPSVFPIRLSPRSRTKTRTQGEDVIVAETTRCGNSCDPKVKTMIPNKVLRAHGHYWVHNRRGRSSISRPDRCAPKVLTRRGVTDIHNPPDLCIASWCAGPPMQSM